MATLKTSDTVYDVKREIDQVKARLDDRYTICTTFETQQAATNIYYSKILRKFFWFVVFQLVVDLAFIIIFLVLHFG